MGEKIPQVGNGKDADTHSRIVYLLVAFGVVTILVVIGCFACSNEPQDIGEVAALIQLQQLSGTVWIPDPVQGPVQIDETTICKLKFAGVPDMEMNLAVMVVDDGNPVESSWRLHANAHGLSLVSEADDVFTARYSVSSDGGTETFSVILPSGQTMYFQKLNDR